ncbi:DNA cytosine methyltransferase [Yersinia enterocolitica]|jgi:DNA (cytosine-5)-methyltransferase 1|nr:DNA cytosine methyltransferase [Yersinia enterocolitica]
MSGIKIASLFSGAGGLDLGFELAGFDISWSNEFDKTIWETHNKNFPNCILDKRSIVDVQSNDIPDISGFIGGPPCQSWSEAGSRKGIDDHRGKLFYEYIRLLNEKKPLFFLAENVSGILHKKHEDAFNKILEAFKSTGYNISFKLLNANNYNVPQDRLRVFIVGILKEYKDIYFEFPNENEFKLNLRDSIFDIKDDAVPSDEKNKSNKNTIIPNHEYMTGGFSSIFMSRNRVRSWDEPSFTIQAGGRHAPIHPSAPKMIKIETDKFEFIKNEEHLYRRMSIRECARVQTFPDSFIFKYNSVVDGYKMVGNAVPVNLAKALAEQIKKQLF